MMVALYDAPKWRVPNALIGGAVAAVGVFFLRAGAGTWAWAAIVVGGGVILWSLLHKTRGTPPPGLSFPCSAGHHKACLGSTSYRPVLFAGDRRLIRATIAANEDGDAGPLRVSSGGECQGTGELFMFVKRSRLVLQRRSPWQEPGQIS